MELLKEQRNETRNMRVNLEEAVPLRAPFVMFIDPCGACNFSCNFCPCNKSDYKKEERHKIMSLELFKKVIDDVCEFEEQVKVIYLYGFGEPLLNKDISKMAKYIKQKKACREIRLVTNGSLLNPKLNQELVDSGIDLIRISVEALDSQDYNKLCGVDLNYENFLENIKDLYYKSRGKTKIAAKIVNATLKNEKDTKRFFDIYTPITDFTFVEDIVEGWPEFEEMVMPQGKLIETDNWIWKRRNYTKCSFALTMMMIHANGEVCPCPNDWKFANSYGNVKTDKVKELWQSKQLRNFQLLHLEKDRSQINFCRHCICSGYDKIDGVEKKIAQKIKV
ncbi:radical SAM protein [Aminipila sp.]|uniref:radical SAM protein n=1 Tax=Aminipila sp. TaxID=2060095 RepID=UPI0028A0B900|nr:radical SAM protein [Aminipila sp.]